jgi:uncharacterized protein YkwD
VNPIAPSTLVTSVPAPTYAAGSQQLAAFNYLNSIRGRCGFGLLKQDTRLDQAADDHANYLALNFTQVGLSHSQTQGRAGFTGVNAGDRAAARGYVGSVSDGLAFGASTMTAESAVMVLSQTTYHAMQALGGSVDFGVASRQPSGTFVVTNYGVPQGQIAQRLAGDAVALSPCDGDVNRLRVHGAELPDPMPGFTPGTYGSPLLARVRDDQTITIDEWTIAPAGGMALSATVRALERDPNNAMLPNMAALIPNAVLGPNTTYNVLLRGKNSGIPFERRYSFTTGAN